MDPEYVLDFIVPIGPTGPTGPTGSSNMCYVDFNTIQKAGILTIKNSQIIPSTSKDFSISGNSVHLATGLYEITFCGILTISNALSRVTIDVLKNGYGDTIDDFRIAIPDTQGMINFSTTNVISFNSSPDLQIKIIVYGSGNISLEKVHLVMKKIS